MKELVEKLVKEGYLKTPRIIEAFLKVDRKDFVPEEMKEVAYEDIALPTMLGQTISQPATVAIMLELLEPEAGDKVMDVGAGSCWQTALLAYIVGQKGKVYAIERLCPLLEWGKKNCEKYGFKDAEFLCQDGTKGLPECAPFDKIIAAAALRAVGKGSGNRGFPVAELFKPRGLKEERSSDDAAGHAIIKNWQDQLAVGGRIVMPIEHSIWLYTKKSATEFEKEEHYGFAFVPLIES